MCAFTASRHNPDPRGLLQRLRGNGKEHLCAVIAVASQTRHSRQHNPHPTDRMDAEICEKMRDIPPREETSGQAVTLPSGSRVRGYLLRHLL